MSSALSSKLAAVEELRVTFDGADVNDWDSIPWRGFLHRFRRHGRVDDEDVGGVGRPRYRCEIPQCVERHLRSEAGVDHERNGAEKYRVAIRHRLGDDVGSERAGMRRPVVHDHLVAPGRGQLVAERARSGIGAASRCKADYQAHGLGRKGLRRRRQRQRGGQRGNQDQAEESDNHLTRIAPCRLESAGRSQGGGGRNPIL